MATTRNVMLMVTSIPRIAWDALVEMYGTDGSPVVNISALESEKMACSICAVGLLVACEGFHEHALL